MFSSTSLDINWYFVAGNHDHNGNISAQIEYSKLEKRWNFPDLYYKLTWKIPSTTMTVDIIMIDTVVLCGNSDHDYKLLQPNGPKNLKDAEAQWLWIEKQLKESKYVQK